MAEREEMECTKERCQFNQHCEWYNFCRRVAIAIHSEPEPDDSA